MSLQKQLDNQYKAISSENEAAEETELPKTIKTAFNKRILILSYKNTNAECLLLEVFLKEALKSLQLEVIAFLKMNFAFKFNIELHAIYTKPNMKEFDNNGLQQKVFKTEMQEGFCTDEFVGQFFAQVENLKRRTQDFQAKEGGWTLLQLEKVVFTLSKYQPLRGAIYIKLPRIIRLKMACINVQNKDNFCFKWAIISALNIQKTISNRTSTYKIDNISSDIIQVKDFRLDFSGLKFPLKIKDISIFIKNNPSISINVFGYDDNSDLIVGPYFKTNEKRSQHINLLYFEGKNKKRTVGHYVWIKNMSRLVGRQMTHSQNLLYMCNECLLHFEKKDKYENHITSCGQRMENVLDGEKCALQFKNSVKVVDVPFVIYAKSKRFPQNSETGNPLSYIYMYFLKCNYDDDLSKWRFFKGPSAPKQFAESLIEDAKHYYRNYSSIVVPKLPLTEEEHFEHEKNNNCCVCSAEISLDVKVKMHCRLTGKYKGPAHHVCAFNYRIPKKFPVIFQNLSFDDALLLIKPLSDIDEDPINVRTVNNNELYISFEKNIKIESGFLKLRFLNFSTFLSCGLESLVEDMSLADFKTFKSTYPDSNEFDFIFTKLIFPYNYLDSIEQLEETCLPGIDKFYEVIIDEQCSWENYENAQKLWSEFKCETLEDYLRVCLEITILLLTDTFEKFRSVCRDAYNLDPCHYFNATEFSWDAMLKVTNIKLSLPADKEMHAFLERGIRGGISKCFQKHSLANNKYLDDYDDQLPSKYLIGFHANDLYGRLMTEYLPEGSFEWESDINISPDSIASDSNIGYIFEVDLEYPSDVFESHKAFPFCSETPDSWESLDGVLYKTNYVIYYKNLQQCLRHGLKLKKIHRILKFKQSDWMKRYIRMNKTPKDSANSFLAHVLKLMNDAVYEKIMKKSAKKIKIINKWENDGRKLGARIYIVRPSFSSVSIIDEHLVGIELYTNTYKNAPDYLEFIISELVKLKMYNFHYEYIMPKYKTNVELNYIDIDSLIYTITTDDLYKDIKNDIFSMVNPTDRSKCHSLLKTLGIMKDANDGVLLKEFIGIRSKLYTLKTEFLRDCALRSNILNSISLSDYTNLLYKNEIYCNSIEAFKSKLYYRYALLLVKELPLSYLDDTGSVLYNELIDKLRLLYYKNLTRESNADEDNIIVID